MDKDMMENELIEVAMQIILHAGNARAKAEEALHAAKHFQYKEAEKILIEVRECLRKAHLAQTEIIQNEIRGRSYAPCLLFTHAQDTLMTIMSEIKLAEEIIDMFQVFYTAMKEDKEA